MQDRALTPVKPLAVLQKSAKSSRELPEHRQMGSEIINQYFILFIHAGGCNWEGRRASL